jgi:hypothetical protein
MPVFQLQALMPYDELQKWLLYFERRPEDWREDLRTAYIMNAFGDKRRPQEIFPAVAAVMKRPESDNPVASLKGSLLFHKMLSAKGGDKLDL